MPDVNVRTPADFLAKEITLLRDLPDVERVDAYNILSAALRDMVRGVDGLGDDAVLGVVLLPVEAVRANDYNPNRVAAPELDLLERSIREDSVTMPVVVAPSEDGEGFVVVDGFHRRLVITSRLGRKYLPASVINAPAAGRMAATVRHNRARGKHVVDRMGDLVNRAIAEGRTDEEVAADLGMSPEEHLRMRQIVGAARALAGPEYSRSWGRDVPTE